MSRADYPINWDLIERYRVRAHPLHSNHPEVLEGLPEGVGEVMGEVLAAHHLLDLVGVPSQHQGRQPDVTDLDARVYRLVRLLLETEDRLERIRSWHGRVVLEDGGVLGYCRECSDPWPCDTSKMASGTYEDDEAG